GQINKVGDIAGPMILEHIVDCVLYIEGGEFNQYRIIRGMKNRFGSTNEIGVFEMTSAGLNEVGNPSLVFLDTKSSVSGSAISAVVQGSRVVFVEVQALVVERGAEVGPLRRVANGIKKPRLDMLCAVLSRRGNVYLGDKDVFVNVVGGITVSDPAVDLAVCAAIKSVVKDEVLDKKYIYFGEVGLTGEIRGTWGLDSVMAEASRVGYKGIYVGNAKIKKSSIEIKVVENIRKL
ncbi:MAG TPA: magnesium chelatase domain-containing protein, partial [Candidatus Dojkabacteria bacterium]|nr:magnesium chelatase domain-containing protein [Candidatus Dojkabacteria bacterium]